MCSSDQLKFPFLTPFTAFLLTRLKIYPLSNFFKLYSVERALKASFNLNYLRPVNNYNYCISGLNSRPFISTLHYPRISSL